MENYKSITNPEMVRQLYETVRNTETKLNTENWNHKKRL